MNDTTLESIADSFRRIADVMEKWYNATYPARERKEAVVTHLETDEERLRREQGDTGEESIQDWTDLRGPREREYDERTEIVGGPRKSQKE